MARTFKINIANSYQKDWKCYKTILCTYCGSRNCLNPTKLKGIKSLSKCKGPGISKRYQKISYHDDGVSLSMMIPYSVEYINYR